MDRLRLLLPALSLLAAWSVAAAPAPASRASRIISLAPHLTELLFAAGAGDRIVGTTEFSDYPAAARGLPRIGDAFRLDYERLVALEPEVAIAWESGTPARTVQRLESLGIRVVPVRTRSLEDVVEAIVLLGRLAGTEAEAQVQARRLEEALVTLRRAHAGAEPLRVFVEIDSQPLYTVTGRHLISEILTLCGGKNVFADLDGVAPAVDLEAVIARDPQLILSTVGREDPAGRWSRFGSITAVRLGLVRAVPPDEVTRPSPRVLEGATQVCAAVDEARRRLAVPGR